MVVDASGGGGGGKAESQVTLASRLGPEIR